MSDFLHLLSECSSDARAVWGGHCTARIPLLPHDAVADEAIFMHALPACRLHCTRAAIGPVDATSRYCATHPPTLTTIDRIFLSSHLQRLRAYYGPPGLMASFLFTSFVSNPIPAHQPCSARSRPRSRGYVDVSPLFLFFSFPSSFSYFLLFLVFHVSLLLPVQSDLFASLMRKIICGRTLSSDC